MRNIIPGKLLLTAFLVLALGCAGGWEVPSPSGVVAGLEISGSVSKQGVPVNEASATLYPCGYHPPLPYSGISADSNLIPLYDTVQNGVYSFSLIDTGLYNLIIEDGQGYSVFLESLLVCSNSKIIQTCSLTASGRVVGTFSDSQGIAPLNSMVYLPGTGYAAYTAANGAFVFDALPAGTYNAKIDTSSNLRFEFVVFPNPVEYYLLPDDDSLPLPQVPAQDAIAPPTLHLSSTAFSVTSNDTSYVIIKK